MRKTLFIRTFWGNLSVIALVLISSLLIASRVFRSWYRSYLGQEMARIVTLARPKIQNLFGDPVALQSELKAMRSALGIRFTLIDSEGRVLGDSDKNHLEMENHIDRPEVAAALKGREGKNLRFSTTEQTRMFYLAVPLLFESEIKGVLRLSVFAKDVDTLIDRFQNHILIGGLVLLLLALIFTYFSSLRISKPIRTLAQAAREITQGSYETRIYTRDSGEIGEMASAFNEMAERQKGLIDTLSQRQNELKAMMNAMVEGLLVIDKGGEVLHHNAAARIIFPDLRQRAPKYWEVCRQAELIAHIQAGFANEGVQNREITLSDQHYSVNTAPIKGTERLIITLHNITEFRRLERIKKDFITNISHEIKTPLTTIHGFVETLEETLEGEPLRHLGIIKRNSERLTHLAKDLLLLSKLEESGSLCHPSAVDLTLVAQTVLPLFAPLANKKGLQLTPHLPPEELNISGDAGRLEDLFINLLDNAIKYTETGDVVFDLHREDGMAVLEVSDTGIGIPTEHLDRIFERFYVVDPSRSRQNGGTGLGLAIVKHIVANHQGTLSVESKPDQGSRFIARFPLLSETENESART